MTKDTQQTKEDIARLAHEIDDIKRSLDKHLDLMLKINESVSILVDKLKAAKVFL